MTRFFRSLKSSRFGTLLVLGGFLLGFPFPARAGLFSIEGIAVGAIGVVAYVVNYIAGYLGGIALAIVSWFTNVAMELNRRVLDTDSIVHVGWNITRDIANLGFVLVIIVIAVSVMLRFETYGSRKVLTRLIAAAIVVNFSLAIMGVFLQFADTFTNFFLSRIPSPSDLGTALASSFEAQKFFLNAQNFSSDAVSGATITASMLSNIASMVFSTAFVLIATIVIGTFAIMLLVRYLHLVILGILAPLVWLFWVIPDLGGQFKTWWNAFIKWTFFAPASSFFIYLSLVAVERMKDIKLEVFTAGSGFFETVFLSVATQGAQMVVIAGLMLGGLIVANKMGIESANIGMNLANKAKAGAIGWAGKQAQRGGRALGDTLRTSGRKFDPTTKQTTTRLQRWGSALQGVPGLQGVGSYLAKQGTEVPKKRPEDIEKYRKDELEALTNEGIEKLATQRLSPTLADPTRVAALAQELAKRNLFGNLDPKRQSQFIDVAERMGTAQAIYNNRPDLVEPRPGETKEKAIERVTKKIKTADITQISDRVLGDSSNARPPERSQMTVTLNLSNPQLGKLGTEGSADQIEAIRNSLQWALTATPQQLQQFQPPLTQDEWSNLQRMVDYINDNPNWQNI